MGKVKDFYNKYQDTTSSISSNKDQETGLARWTPWFPLDSSFLQSFRYQASTDDMEIKFRNGNIYFYGEVSFEIADGFSTCSSPGKYYNQYIKAKMDYERKYKTSPIINQAKNIEIQETKPLDAKIVDMEREILSPEKDEFSTADAMVLGEIGLLVIPGIGLGYKIGIQILLNLIEKWIRQKGDDVPEVLGLTRQVLHLYYGMQAFAKPASNIFQTLTTSQKNLYLITETGEAVRAPKTLASLTLLGTSKIYQRPLPFATSTDKFDINFAIKSIFTHPKETYLVRPQLLRMDKPMKWVGKIPVLQFEETVGQMKAVEALGATQHIGKFNPYIGLGVATGLTVLTTKRFWEKIYESVAPTPKQWKKVQKSTRTGLFYATYGLSGQWLRSGTKKEKKARFQTQKRLFTADRLRLPG